MYFHLGGGTLKGVSRPGEVVWSRIFVGDDAQLHMDLGRARVVGLTAQETERRWQLTTPQWPIMHAVTHGVSREQMMARHKANHLNVAYSAGDDPRAADELAAAKAALADALGIRVHLCGENHDRVPLTEAFRRLQA